MQPLQIQKYATEHVAYQTKIIPDPDCIFDEVTAACSPVMPEAKKIRPALDSFTSFFKKAVPVSTPFMSLGNLVQNQYILQPMRQVMNDDPYVAPIPLRLTKANTLGPCDASKPI